MINGGEIKKITLKKIGMFAVVILFCVESTICSHASNYSWQSEYTDVLTKLELSQVAGNVVMLRDMDLDGIPELFFGYEYPVNSFIVFGWTYNNGKLKKLEMQAYATAEKNRVFVSAVRNARLYYNRNTDEFRFFDPQTYMHTYAGEDSQVRLMYDGHNLSTGPEIYSVEWEQKYDGDGQESYKEEEGYTFGGIKLNKVDFYDRLKSFYAGWKQESSSLLIADESGIFCSAKDKLMPESKLWTEEHRWNQDTVKWFMTLWNPSAVKGRQKATLNNMKFTLDEIGDADEAEYIKINEIPSYIIFGNNYVKIRDLAEILQNSD